MKLQVTQENLAKALGIVGRVANTRGTLPILSNIALRTVDNRLSIEATNLDIAITQAIGSKVETMGAITVPARLMQDFISSLPGGVISLELDEHRLKITTDKYQSVINGTSFEEFPVMPAIAKGTSWTMVAQKMKQALSQVLIAASSDEARPTLTGVYLHVIDGKLYAVATDSYRLAERELTASKSDLSLLVPASAIHELIRVIGDSQDEIEITSDEQQVLFQTGDIKLVTRLIEGKYPDYRKLIPQKFETVATVNRSDFINITKVSSLFARESAGSITITADADKGEISIRSIASQLGENTSTATATISGGGDITLNSRYLLDALQAMNGEEVEFCFNGKLEPSELKDPKNKEYIHIIMPLKS
ncbi:MAG: DNA polymerase III subunit beta [Candidatus Saccharibacteria bacterium]|nr:DNA polymerase III subunit beta [Candidatus Saccharibacteria bacterium]